MQQEALRELETQLLDTDLYQGEKKGDLQGLLRTQAALKDRIEFLEQNWLELQEELEASI